MGGSSKTETQNQTRDPWAPAQPGLKDILSKAQTYGADQSIWNPTFSSNTTSGIAGLGQLGQQSSFGAGTIRSQVGADQMAGGVGRDELSKTASGGYLNGNPYLDSVLSKSSQDTADQVNAQFSGAGRYGSGAHTGVLAREIGGLNQQARLGEYDKERGYQVNAAGSLNGQGLQSAALSPTADSADAQQQMLQIQAGQMQDQMAQAQRQAPIAGLNWQTGVTAPIAGLGGTANGTTTTSQSPNIASMVLGGGMMAAGALSGNPGMAAGGLGQLGGVYQPSSSIAGAGQLPWLR